MDKHINHMEVRWKEFKGFKDTGWIKIKPITILLGSNNSGKSNFLAPFLLMNQTVNSRDRHSPIILKGNLYDAGNYQELVKEYITEKEFYFGFRYHLHENKGKLAKVGTYPPGGFDVTFNVASKEAEIKLKSMTVYDVFGRKYFKVTKDNDGKSTFSGIGLQEHPKHARQWPLYHTQSARNRLCAAASKLGRSSLRFASSHLVYSPFWRVGNRPFANTAHTRSARSTSLRGQPRPSCGYQGLTIGFRYGASGQRRYVRIVGRPDRA